MKKFNKRQRKLRKCEVGLKTKSLNKGHRYIYTSKGLLPYMWATKHLFDEYEKGQNSKSYFL